jgi:hypothetical protein
MNKIAISVLKGGVVALVAAVPLWWLPSFLQQGIPDFWLAVMTVPPVMLGGYVAARQASRPILTGVLTGLVVISLILTVALTTGELWVAPIMLFVGGVTAALGAYVAVVAGHTAARK